MPTTLDTDPLGNSLPVELPENPGDFSEARPLDTGKTGKPVFEQPKAPGLLDRFVGNLKDSRQNTLGGAASTALVADQANNPRPPVEAPASDDPFERAAFRTRSQLLGGNFDPATMQERARSELDDRINDQIAYKAMPSYQGILEGGAALAGQVVGGALSPENLAFPEITAWASPVWRASHPFVSSLISFGLGQAAVQAASDPVKQALEIKAGLRKEFDATETALAVPMGFAFGAGIKAFEHVGSAAFRATVDIAKERMRGMVTSPLNPELRPPELAEPPAANRPSSSVPSVSAIEPRPEPPVADGMVRLYRADAQGFQPPSQHTHVEFSRDVTQAMDTASWGAKPGERTTVSFIDVPEDVALARSSGSRVTLPGEVAAERVALPETKLPAETSPSEKPKANTDEPAAPSPVEQETARVESELRAATEEKMELQRQTQEAQSSGDKDAIKDLRAKTAAADSKIADLTQRSEVLGRDKALHAGGSAAASSPSKAPVSTNKLPHELQLVDNLGTLMRDIADTLDLTVRQGVKYKGNLAEFDKITQVIRTRGATGSDFIHFTHELGHYIEQAVGRKLSALIDNNPTSMRAVNTILSGRTPDELGREGFAEFMAGYITNRSGTTIRAPVFVKEFETLMQKEAPELLNVIERAHRGYVAYDTAPTLARDNITRREDIKARQDAEKVTTFSAMKDAVDAATGAGNRRDADILGRSVMGQWADKFYTNYVNRLHPFTVAQAKLQAEFMKKYGTAISMRADEDVARLAQMWANGAGGAGMQDALNGIADRNFNRSGPAILQTWQKVISNAVTGADQTSADAARAAIDRFDKYLKARWHLAIEDQRASGMSNMSRPATELSSGEARLIVDDVERMHPEWRSHAEEVYDYNKRLARKQYENGMIGKEKLDFFLHPDNHQYVPLRRDMQAITEDSVRAFTARGDSALESLGMDFTRKGSDRPVLSPMESILLRTMMVNDQIAQNEVFNALRNLVKQVGGKEGARIAEEIPNTKIRAMDIDIEEGIYQAARKNGWTETDARDLAQQTVATMGPDTRATLYTAQNISAGSKPIIFGWDKGERVALQLTDGEFGAALQQAYDSMGPKGATAVAQSLGLLSDLFVTTASTLRAGATGTPTFMVKNMVRDSLMQFLMVPEVRVPGMATASGIKSLAKEDKFWSFYQATSGIRGGAATNALSDISRVEAAMIEAGVPRGSIATFATVKDVIGKMEFSETGGRVGIFKSVYDANLAMGRDERWAIYDAAQKARDFVDFGRYGSKMQAVSRMVPFLNANIQGIDKFFRTYGSAMWGAKNTIQEQEYQTQLRQQLLSRSAALAALSYGISALYADDPVYQSIPVQMRSQYWIFRLPFMKGGPVADGMMGGWVVVPKPWEPASVFNLAERVQQFIHTGDGTEAKAFLKSLHYSFSVPVPTDFPLIKTISGLESNYNSFFDIPIVPEAYQKIAPHLQANEYTNGFYKALAGALNEVWNSQDAHKNLKNIPMVGAALAALWSPMEAQFLAQGLFGDVPRELGGVGGLVKAALGNGTFKFDDVPGLRAFVRDRIASGQPMRETYNQVGQTDGRLTIAANTYQNLIKNGDPSGAQDYFDKLDRDQRDFVRLKTSGGGIVAEAVNPMVRMSNLAAAVRNVRSGLLLDAGLATLTDPSKRIKLEPGTRDIAIQAMNEMVTVEARNSLTVQGVSGYKGQEIIPTKPYMDMLKAISPELAREMSARFADKKVLPIEAVQEHWPKMQDAIRVGGAPAEIASAVKRVGFEAVSQQGYFGGGTKVGRGAADSSGIRIKRGKQAMPALPAEGASQ